MDDEIDEIIEKLEEEGHEVTRVNAVHTNETTGLVEENNIAILYTVMKNEEKGWVTRKAMVHENIFSDIVHFAISMSSPIMQEKCKYVKHFHPEEKKRSIIFLVEAILSYLKQNSQNWK